MSKHTPPLRFSVFLKFGGLGELRNIFKKFFTKVFEKKGKYLFFCVECFRFFDGEADDDNENTFY